MWVKIEELEKGNYDMEDIRVKVEDFLKELEFKKDELSYFEEL